MSADREPCGRADDGPGGAAGSRARGRPGTDPAGDADADAEGGERLPPFLRYGLLTVAFYGVVVAVLHFVARVDVDGPSLAAFSTGFLLFMTFYFGAMWVGWLFLR